MKAGIPMFLRRHCWSGPTYVLRIGMRLGRGFGILMRSRLRAERLVELCHGRRQHFSTSRAFW